MNKNALNKKFGLITGGACLFIFAWRFAFSHKLTVIIAGIGCLLLLMALISPRILNPLRIAWDKIGEVLGMISSTIILTIIFFVIITPIAFIMRLSGKRPLNLKFTAKDKSYWQSAETTEGSSLKQQF